MTVKLPELWLQYAGDDLRSAKILLAEGVYNVACLHAQQAVENCSKPSSPPKSANTENSQFDSIT